MYRELVKRKVETTVNQKIERKEVTERRVLQEKEAADMPQYQPYSVNYYAGDSSMPEAEANSTSYSSAANVTYRPTSSPAPSQQHAHQHHQQQPQQSYQQQPPPSAANGHAGAGGGGGVVGRDANPSPNSSQLSLHSSEGHPQLISRTTQRNSTQQVTTVTKVIRQRELRHIGADGQPVDYPGVYGTNHPPPPPPGSDYSPYGYSGMADPSRGIARATSPGSHEAPHRQDYLNYGVRPHSPTGDPGSRRNYDTYASPHRTSYHDYDSYQQQQQQQQPQQHHPAKGSRPSDYAIYQRSEAPPPGAGGGVPAGYGNYSTLPRDAERPQSPPSLPSEASGSPVTQRVMMAQGPGGVGPGPNVNAPAAGMVSPRGLAAYPTSGYDELDNALGPGPRTNARSPDLHDAYQGHPPPPHPGHYGMAGYMGMQDRYDDDVDLGHEDQHLLALDDPSRFQSPSMDGGDSRDVTWRDPDLPEVIDFLGHPNNVVKANAAAYLQHLCYMDDHTKQKTRGLGGIAPLVSLLNHEIPEVHRNACGALRNLSYGRQNDENKRAIKIAGGISSLVRLLRKTPDNEVRELVTGVLWNLSSCEDLKKPIIDDALAVITNNVVIPHSGWDRNLDSAEGPKPSEIYWSTVFRNASGVLRNVSSAGEYARKKLRECEGLVDALFYLVKAAIGKNDIDNKSVENCVCVLRNLSYRCQEVDDPNYDRHEPQTQSRAGVPAKGDNLGCFGGSKKKKEAQNTEKQHKEGASASPRPRSDPVKGMEMLWQPEVVQPYLSLLSDCSNPETLEAAAGAIQNLAACYWQPSVDIRAAVRKEKGLPILVELLRMEVDRVVCAVATALRNLALDQRNKELIGKYAMGDLVQKMPSETQQYDTGTSDETIAAVLATLNEVIRRNAEFARTFLETGGIDRLMYISRQRVKFSGKVVKFSSQVLYNLWQHQELREAYKKQGWKENNFVTRTMAARSLSPANAHNTLNRPISSQGGTKYEDKTLQRGHELNSAGGAQGLSSGPPPNVARSPEHVPYVASEEVPMMDMNYTQEHMHAPGPPSIRPPVGGVQVFPPGTVVNREKKKGRHFDDGQPAADHWDYDRQQPPPQQQQPPMLLLDGHGNGGPGGDGQAGGDSWV